MAKLFDFIYKYNLIIKMKHTGTGVVRGMPVQIFQGCEWSEKEKTTVRYSLKITGNNDFEMPFLLKF